jgi:hypothetical protein
VPTSSNVLLAVTDDSDCWRAKLSQLNDNLASLDLSLSAEQLKTLDEASQIDLGFLQTMFAKDLVRGLMSGGVADKIIT